MTDFSEYFFFTWTDMTRYCTLVLALTFYTSDNILQLGMIDHTHKSFAVY